MNSEPQTLQQATVYFADPDNCVEFLLSRRWPDGVVKCPICDRVGAKYIPTRRVWQCKSRHKGSQFSIKVGTIFEDSALPLDKWLMAMWMVANCRNGISSHEIARTVGITQKSAWHMLHRIRLGMKDDEVGQLGGRGRKGPIQADETHVGGNPRFMHEKRRIAYSQGDKKAIVMGMLDSDTRQVRAMVIPNTKRETLQNKILEHVSYQGIDATHLFVHKTVNHTIQYVNGKVHTQGIENFWSLLKRSLRGTYVAVEPFHLDRYVDEQVFRFNNRVQTTDAMRFNKLVLQTVGKRLTYAELTGKESALPAF